MGVGRQSGLTAAQRLDDLKASAHKFGQHLVRTPPIVLTPELRTAVAAYAREALVKSKGGSGLPQNACLRPGTAFEAIADLKHESLIKCTDQKAARVLSNLVHTVINHQTKVDYAWYEKTIKALGDLDLVPATFKGEARHVLVSSLYCEIVVSAIVSHGINITFVCMGLHPPALPTPSHLKDSPGPTLLDVTTLLKNGSGLRYASKAGFAPFFLYKDMFLPRASKSFSRFELETLKARLIIEVPFLGYSPSPHDLVVLDATVDVYLYNQNVSYAFNTLYDFRRTFV